MLQTMSVTDARDNFPSLVRRVAEQDEAVVVTSHNQPRAVLLRWETYQEYQRVQSEGAQYRLLNCVAEMERIIDGLLEAYRPDSLDMEQATQDLWMFAREAWTVCRLLDRPRRHLAVMLTDGLMNGMNLATPLTQEQLTQIRDALMLFKHSDLHNDQVSNVSQKLIKTGLHLMLPFGDGLAALYEDPAGEPV